MFYKKYLKWALQFAAVLIRTPFVEFQVSIDEELVSVLKKTLADNKFTDEDIALILDYVASQLGQ